MKTLTQIPLWLVVCLTFVGKSKQLQIIDTFNFNASFPCVVISLFFYCFCFFFRSDDEETFCRALVEYTRACSHVGYPVREWRDNFPSCSKLPLKFHILSENRLAHVIHDSVF